MSTSDGNFSVRTVSRKRFRFEKGTQHSAGDEKRNVRMRFRRALRRAMVPHAVAIPAVLPARRQDKRAAVVSVERIHVRPKHDSRE